MTLNELSYDKVTMDEDKINRILKVYDARYLQESKILLFVVIAMVTVTAASGRVNWLQILLILLFLAVFVEIIIDRYYSRKLIKEQKFKYIAVQEIRKCCIFNKDIMCTFKDEGLYNGTAYIIDGDMVEKGDKVIVFSIDNKNFWCI